MANLKEIIPVSVAVSDYDVAVQSTVTPGWMGYSALRKKNHLFQEHNKITLLRVRTRTSYFTTTSSTFVELQSATAVCVTKNVTMYMSQILDCYTILKVS